MNKPKQVFRIKIEDAKKIQQKSFELTKSALLANHRVIYKESDLVNFIISEYIDNIIIDEQGFLTIKK